MFTRLLPRLCMRQALMDGMAKTERTEKDLKQAKTLDDVLKDVLDEALAARDRGEHTDADFVYRRTQEKMYEAENGRPPPSKSTQHLNHIPPEPRGDVRRLIPWEGFDDDPWPQEHVSAFKATERFIKDTYGAGGLDADDAGTAAAGSSPQETKKPKATPSEALSEFSDAADELGHWEAQYVTFLRSQPLGLRRALPLLVEHYKLLTHRLIRAERRFIAARDRAVGCGLKLDPQDFALSEAIVERVRKIYSETHRSLAQASYDPTNMNRNVSGACMKMDEEQFQEWLDEKRAERNRMMGAFEEAPVVPPAEEEAPAELTDRERASKALKDESWADDFANRLDRMPKQKRQVMPGEQVSAPGAPEPPTAEL